MVIEDFPNRVDGAKMYGVTLDMDIHILEDELGIKRNNAYSEIERVLQGVGYKHVQYSVYVCPEPKSSEIQVVHDTIMALKGLPWFSQAVRQIIAFEVSTWGDITGAFE